MLKPYLVPVGSFLIAVALSLAAGPARSAYSFRPAQQQTGCTPTCGLQQDNVPLFLAAVAVNKQIIQESSTITTENINCHTCDGGKVTVESIDWKVSATSTPADTRGQVTSRISGTLNVAGEHKDHSMTIAVEMAKIPADGLELSGTYSVSVKNLAKNSDLSGNFTWQAFTTASNPGQGKKDVVAGHSDLKAWKCSAE